MHPSIYTGKLLTISLTNEPLYLCLNLSLPQFIFAPISVMFSSISVQASNLRSTFHLLLPSSSFYKFASCYSSDSYLLDPDQFIHPPTYMPPFFLQCSHALYFRNNNLFLWTLIQTDNVSIFLLIYPPTPQFCVTVFFNHNVKLTMYWVYST